jgi:type I restriction enzyme R subunit
VGGGFLVNPTVVDARTQVTTELLSQQGFVVTFTDDEGEDKQETYKQREFEKRFFSKATNPLVSGYKSNRDNWLQIVEFSRM